MPDVIDLDELERLKEEATGQIGAGGWVQTSRGGFKVLPGSGPVAIYLAALANAAPELFRLARREPRLPNQRGLPRCGNTCQCRPESPCEDCA